MGGGVCFSIYYEASLRHQLGDLESNSVLTLSRDSIRFHRFRAQSYQTAPHFRCQSQAQVVIWASNQLGTNWSFQQTSFNLGCQLQVKVVSCTSAKSLRSCLIPCDPIDGSPPGSSVPGILQARILEWVAISFSSQYF